jgi:RimJ/RimL family protein N-acetyltransferase
MSLFLGFNTIALTIRPFTKNDAFDPKDVRILLAIEHKEDEALIGWCGVFPNDLLDPTEREIAYALSKHYRNRGYATEAVVGISSFVSCLINPAWNRS